MLVRMLPAAEEDIENIVDFLYSESRNAAIMFLNRFEETKRVLSEFPYLGRIPGNLLWSLSGYRYYVMREYLIFYRIESDVILIFRIFHGSQDYENILNS